jgi:hypothetical protein
MDQEECHAVTALGANYVFPSLNKVGENQDLLQYFSRPRIIRTGSFTTGFLGPIFNEDVTAFSLFNTFFPNGIQRLLGMHGVRFTLCFTLQVATTPFHQGMVVLNFQYDTAGGIPNNFKRNRFAATSTNIPHVRLDINNSTAVQLRIPFLSKYEYLPIYNMYAEQSLYYGILGASTILPIGVGSTLGPPTYQLLVHLEDLEAVGVMPESNINIVYQSGKADVQVQEDKASKPISGALMLASKAVKLAGPYIPYFSSISGATSWALEKASHIAKIFGYSKPPVRDPPTRMLLDSSALEFNVDKIVPVATLGASVDNRLAVGAFAGSDVDEMAFSYLFSRPSQVFLGSLSTGNVAGDRLYTCSLSPSCLYYKNSNTSEGNTKLPRSAPVGQTYNAFLPSNLLWIASMFKQWQGSMTFRFTFAKTKFHTGRVQVSYTPFVFEYDNFDGLTDPTVVKVPGTLQPFGLTKMFDLRDDNVFEFTVPYTCPAPWVSFYTTVGSITMQVLQPLIAPDTVSPTVRFLVEVYSNDFKVAIPNAVLYPVHQNATNVLQSGAVEVNVLNPDPQMTVGESLNSVKQLIMIPTCGDLKQVAGEAGNTSTLPYWWYHAPLPAGLSNIRTPNNELDLWSFQGNLAQGYAFCRGGTDYHCQIYARNPDSYYVCASIDHGIRGKFATTPNLNAVFTPSYAGGFKYIKNGTGGVHFRVPAYQRLNRLSTWAFNFATFQIAVDDGNTRVLNENPIHTGMEAVPMLTVFNTETFENDGYIQVAKSASDDALLGHYMGPPPLFIPLTLNVEINNVQDSVSNIFKDF